MEKYMRFIQDANPDYLRTQKLGPNFADWLAPDQNTNKELIATAYWALSSSQMSQMAHAIGREDASHRYADLYNKIRDAFQKAYVGKDGLVATGTQASYVLALYPHLMPPELENVAVDRLVKDIDAHGGHLTTGFLATPFLLFTLTDHGRTDVAYKLLLNETYPSWGYMLSKGATTWWERWNSDSGDPAMNSFNHYAFGSVVAWIYRAVAGIDASTANPGFHEILISPRLDSRLTEANAEYNSAYGKITTAWKGTPVGPWILNVTVPANTTAQVILPRIPGTRAMQDGRPISGREIIIGSGTYEFALK
jgi:alpha-L-rhamnosidase